MNWLALGLGVPLALALTVAARALGRRRGWLDRPGPARLHALPVPRLGGLAMYLAFVVTVLIVARPLDLAVGGLLLGATLLVAIMLIDDLRGLRPRDKFLAQLLAAAVPIAMGIRINVISNPFEGGVIELPLAVVIPFTLFWIVGMMNAINFADGLDGLAGGVSVIAGVVLVVLSQRLGLPLVATLALVLAAVALGFLPLNIYRSSIIMGDAGSHFLGFAIAVIAIMGPAKIATAILVLGVPILEVAWSIVRRLAPSRDRRAARRAASAPPSMGGRVGSTGDRAGLLPAGRGARADRPLGGTPPQDIRVRCAGGPHAHIARRAGATTAPPPGGRRRPRGASNLRIAVIGLKTASGEVR